MYRHFIAGVIFTAVIGLVVLVAMAQTPVRVVNGTYDPCLDPTKITLVDIVETAASGALEHVAISGSTRIYVCSGKIQGGAAGTITLRFGTGTACATSPTDLDVTLVVSAGDGSLWLPAGGTFARSGTGQALCTVRSASMTIHGHLRFVQE